MPAAPHARCVALYFGSAPHLPLTAPSEHWEQGADWTSKVNAERSKQPRSSCADARRVRAAVARCAQRQIANVNVGFT